MILRSQDIPDALHAALFQVYGVVMFDVRREPCGGVAVTVEAIDGRRRRWDFLEGALRFDVFGCLAKLQREAGAWTAAMSTPEAYGLEDDHAEVAP